MKVIAINKITSISADTEDVNFPVSLTQDDHPKRVFKTDGDYQVTLTCEVSSGTSGIAIFGTNAQGAAITVSDPNEATWGSDSSFDSENSWAYTEPSVSFDIEQTGSAYALWADYGYINTAMEISIVLTTEIGNTLEVGVVRCGEVLSFADPAYGLQEGLHTYSTPYTTSNGATYINERDTVRTFSGVITEDRDVDFYKFMTATRTAGLTPMAWRVTNMSSTNWVVYARFNQMPQGSHGFPKYSQINFNLIEVL